MKETPKMAKPEYVLTLGPEHVGAGILTAAKEHAMAIIETMGRIQTGDVGKRVFRVRTEAGNAWVYQVENNEQLAHRAKESAAE
jgi:hypothetical protein